MQLPGRHGSLDSYRYGFNGKESDDEVKGIGNSYDFGSRMHDPRVGRFFSIDPKWREFESTSPYVFGHNNPILFVDREGENPIFYLIAKFGISWVRNQFTSRRAAIEIADSEGISEQKRRNILNNIGIADGILSTVDIAEFEQSQKEMIKRNFEAIQEAQFDTFNQLSSEELERSILGPEGIAIKEQAEQIIAIIENWDDLDPYTQGQVKGVIYGTLAQAVVTRGATTRMPKLWPKLAKNFKLKFKPKVPKRKHVQRVDDFISEHAHTRHKNDPTRTSSRSRTQYGEDIDVKKIREVTINEADEVIPNYDANGNLYSTTYKKTFRGNISTSDTPTRESRVIINHQDASRSS